MMPYHAELTGRTLPLLADRELDALVVYSDGTCNILRPSYLQYFAGFRPMGPHNAAVVTRAGDVVLLVEPPWDAERARRHSWIQDVRGSADLAEDLPAVLRRIGASNAIGVAGGDAMTTGIHDALSAVSHLVAADEVVETLARVKSPAELELVRDVAEMADQGFEALLEATRAGIREYELVAELEFAMRRAGADDNFILIGSGRHSHAMRAPVDRRLEPGDLVIVEITPEKGGQFIQLCRTIVLGAPEPELVERYDLLMRAYLEAVKTLRVGAPAAHIASTINGVLAEAGYREFCYPPYMRTRGHGFGVGSIAPGMIIDEATDHALTEHQVIVVHPNQYLPETGYLACGETFLVTRSGAERLARTETRLYSKPA